MAVEVSTFRPNIEIAIPRLEQIPSPRFTRFFRTLYLPANLSSGPSLYDKADFGSTKMSVIGDSIVGGFSGYNAQGGKISYPPGEYLVKCVNESFGVGWKSDVFAQEGATAKQVRQQILSNQRTFFDSSVNGIDVNLGMLGNDLINAIAEEFNPAEMESLMHGRWSPTFMRRFLGSVQSGIRQHEIGIHQVAHDLESLYLDGAKIRRLFFQGVPNMGHASQLEMVLGEDNIGPTSEVNLENADLLKMTLSMFARLMDWNNRRIVSGLKLPFPLLYVDAFHALGRQDFTVMHPNKQGYQRIALQMMKLQQANFQGKITTFRHEYENRVRQDKLAA